MYKLLFLLFFTISSLHAMILDECSSLKKLPRDIRQTVFDYVIDSTKGAKKATMFINNLADTLYINIDNDIFTKTLINNLAQKYSCSHETIAKNLRTKHAHHRLELQLQLKALCCKNNHWTLKKLEKLIKKDVILEFTYNDNYEQKTPLMLAMDYQKSMFTYLLNKGVDIHSCNTSGISILHHVTNKPRRHFLKLIELPEFNPETSKFNFNITNKCGETALLYCLIQRKNPANEHFVNMIIKLLEAQVDPEKANKKYITPLMAAQKLKDNDEKDTIIQLITDAITQKHAIKEKEMDRSL